MEFSAGQAIFDQGDPSDLCYQVVSGKVEIRIKGAIGQRVISELGSGEVFGEMGIIDDSPRSASAVAAERTICVAYTPDEILEMLETDPKEALAYIRTLIRRVRGSNVKIARQVEAG